MSRAGPDAGLCLVCSITGRCWVLDITAHCTGGRVELIGKAERRHLGTQGIPGGLHVRSPHRGGGCLHSKLERVDLGATRHSRSGLQDSSAFLNG